MSANLFLLRWNTVGILFALLISILFTSCFSDLKSSRTTTVSFNMSRETVQKILGNSAAGRSAAREGDDPAASDVYIDVTLFAIDKQTRTAPISPNAGISMTFEEIPVGTSVYAKAKIYRYADAEKTVKDVIYNGESSKIIVREGLNALNLRLAGAVLTVTFDSNGGSSVSSQTAATGTSIQKPADPVKPVSKTKYSRYDNYAFEGWYSDPELTKGYNFNSAVTDDTTLYAKWLKDFVFVEGGAMTNYLATDRNITISDLFVSDHEVTQAEYQAVTNTNPSHYNSYGDDLPVENISWFDAIKYCNLLSIKEDLPPCYKVNNSTNPSDWGTLTPTTQVSCNLSARGYRLPTEAEWEYIATKAERTNETLDRLAIYSKVRPQKIKTPLADELYLSDLLGNVAEWCFDVFSDSITATTNKTGPGATASENYRVVRGGAYNSSADDCAKDVRASSDPTLSSDSIGFRVVRTAIDAYTVVTNTVTFLTNGGSAVATQYITEGDTALRPSNPTKTGYNFATWLYGGSEFDFDTIIAQDIILEAKWNPITYTVKFDKGLAVPTQTMPSQTFTYDVAQELSQNIFTDSQGYKFGGWARTAPTEKPLTDVDSYRDFVDKQSVSNLTTVDGDEITLYAIWIEGERSTITYNLDSYDTSTLTPKTYVPNETITLPVADESSGRLIRTGYTFGGWYTTENCVSGTDITGWGVNGRSGDMTVYGKWIADQYTIQYFNIDGCTWASGYTKPTSYTIEDSVSLPTDTQISKQGYNFEGWYDSDDESTANRVYDWYADDHKTGTVTLYAKWSAGSATYKVEHYFQKLNADGTGSTDYEINTTYTNNGVAGTTGQTTDAAAKKATVVGFTYDHVENATIAPDNSSVAKVYYKRNTISYNFTKSSGESWTDSTITNNSVVKTGLYGATFTAPEIKKTGYTFNGWKIYGSNSLITTFGPETDKTIIADWTANNYTVTIYLNGGTLFGSTSNHVEQLNIEEDNTLDLTDTEFTPTSTNYTFAGYYTDASFTNAAPDIITLNNPDHIQDWELYAKWTYTITFNTNGGSTVAPIADVLYTQAASTPAAPTKEGYDFGDWYTDSGLTTSYNFANSASTGNVTLYAEWTVHNYSITYHYGGATMSGTNPSTYSITSPADLNYSPSMNGKIFVGWFLDEDATGAKITSVKKSSIGELKDVDLYAYFTNSIFVSAEGLSTNDGLCPATPVDSVSTAVSKIVTLNKGSSFDWNIAIVGTVTGTQVINNSSLTTSVAKSVTLTGHGTGATLDGGSLTTGDNRTTLTIDTTYPITITNLIITGGRGTNISGSTYGGGLYVKSGTVSLGDGVQITGNGCNNGGGVYIARYSTLYMYGSAIVGDTLKTPQQITAPPSTSNWAMGNYANPSTTDGGGGGIRNDGKLYLGYTRYVDDTDFDDKQLTGGIYGNWSYRGGGIYNYASGEYDIGEIRILTGNISKNSAYDGNNGRSYICGGGICNIGRILFDGGTISNNYAKSGGGAVSLIKQTDDTSKMGEFYMSGGNITENESSASGGGAFYLNSGILGITGGSIYNNIANAGGSGGIDMYEVSEFTLEGGEIYGNQKRVPGSPPSTEPWYAIWVWSGTFKISGDVSIPYTDENMNFVKMNTPIIVDGNITNDIYVSRYSEPTTTTQILENPDWSTTLVGSNYSKFHLIEGDITWSNGSWTIGSNGKAQSN
ncbi:MAG: InlB B-repeat-containing protein [Treponema sp.]|nr:InlB B-repeat-containing protein [Treponema sp.]